VRPIGIRVRNFAHPWWDQAKGKWGIVLYRVRLLGKTKGGQRWVPLEAV
jgi:hypothetical protein